MPLTNLKKKLNLLHVASFNKCGGLDHVDKWLIPNNFEDSQMDGKTTQKNVLKFNLSLTFSDAVHRDDALATVF